MIDDVIISYNNDCSEENRWFFESCADESRQCAVKCRFTHKTITPPNLTAEEIKRHIKSCRHGFVFLAYMHGHKKGIVNECGDDIVSDTINSEIFKGNIFYTFSCQCGNDLKDELMNRNTALFWGYKNDTHIVLQEEFVECAIEGIKQFLSGKTVGDAKKAMEEKYIENHYKIGGLKGALLLENKDNMVVVGDMSLTIFDFPQ
jgi:hypothetical protein